MLPLYGALLQQMQINQALQAQARYQGQQEMEKARILAFKRELLKDAQRATQQLAPMAKTNPHHAYVWMRIMSADLNYFHLGPDDFEEVKEKEDVVLLGRKIQNIDAEIEANISPAQLETCQKYLNALYLYNLMDETVYRLDKNQEWQAAVIRLRAAQKKRTFYIRLRWLLAMILLAVLAGSFSVFSSQIGFQHAADFLILWVLAGVVLGAVLLVWTDINIPNNIHILAADYKKLEKESRGGDDEYWKLVHETFGENIHLEEMKARKAEQLALVQTLATDELGFPKDDPEQEQSESTSSEIPEAQE